MPQTPTPPRLRRKPVGYVSLRLPEQQRKELDKLVKSGHFMSVSEAVRRAILQLLEGYAR